MYTCTGQHIYIHTCTDCKLCTKHRPVYVHNIHTDHVYNMYTNYGRFTSAWYSVCTLLSHETVLSRCQHFTILFLGPQMCGLHPGVPVTITNVYKKIHHSVSEVSAECSHSTHATMHRKQLIFSVWKGKQTNPKCFNKLNFFFSFFKCKGIPWAQIPYTYICITKQFLVMCFCDPSESRTDY